MSQRQPGAHEARWCADSGLLGGASHAGSLVPATLWGGPGPPRLWATGLPPGGTPGAGLGAAHRPQQVLSHQRSVDSQMSCQPPSPPALLTGDRLAPPACHPDRRPSAPSRQRAGSTAPVQGTGPGWEPGIWAGEAAHGRGSLYGPHGAPEGEAGRPRASGAPAQPGFRLPPGSSVWLAP